MKTQQTQLNFGNTNASANTNTQVELTNYLDQTANSIAQNQAQMDAIDMQIQNLKIQKEALKKVNEDSEKQITNTLDSLGIDKYETSKYSFKPRNYMPKVIIKNKEMIPRKYEKQVIQTRIDKTLLRNDLKAGNQISGVYLEPTRTTKITKK